MYAVKALITWHCFFFIVLESIGIDETYDILIDNYEIFVKVRYVE